MLLALRASPMKFALIWAGLEIRAKELSFAAIRSDGGDAQEADVMLLDRFRVPDF